MFQAWAVNYWLDLGMPKEKLVAGLITYGRGFTLGDIKNDNEMGAFATGSAPGGKYTWESGFYSKYEVICKNRLCVMSR